MVAGTEFIDPMQGALEREKPKAAGRPN